jgi:hypothetical protein
MRYQTSETRQAENRIMVIHPKPRSISKATNPDTKKDAISFTVKA